MKEIKFRAWDEDLKMFVYFQMGKLLPTGTEFEEYTKLSTKGVDWQQFTGLTDKNGKEIYEGDVVHLTKGWRTVEKDEREKDTGEDFIEGEVKYFTPYAGFGISGVGFDKLSLFPIEIIGNVMENPELVK